MARRFILLAAALLLMGCDAHERRKYDAWFPPGQSRQQIIQQYGSPIWTIDRPADNPTPKQWVDAALAKGPWLHPDWFPRNIAETEHRTSQRIVRLDSFSPRSHWAWHEYLDFIWGGHMDVVYYDDHDAVISSQQMPSYVWSD